MSDREKAIRILEGNYKDFVLRHNRELLTVNELIALLNEQEPRVLTLEELKQFEDSPCWFESHGTYMGKKGFWIIPYMFTCYKTMYYVFPLLSVNERGDMHYSELGLSAYNKAWRCWTARPTDEQREAVKWDD